MNAFHLHLPGLRCLAIAVVLLATTGGCRPADEIRTYRVPKQDSEAGSMPTAAAEPTHRMLALIVPSGERAWFFKVVGTLEQMEQLEAPVTEFYTSLAVEEGEIQWQPPEDWHQEPGGEMRLATFAIPAGDEKIEMSVSRLPWTGDGPAGLLANVNRWRGQMGLPAVGPVGLANCTREIQLGELTATEVDLAGTFSTSGMSPPFASGAPRSESAAPDDQLPPNHPQVETSDELTLDTPEGWQPLPPSGFRKAAFAVVQEEGQAEVTVTDFESAGTAMSDPLANVNRWLGQLGREPVDEAELDGLTSPIEVGGNSGTYVKLESAPQASRPLAMLVAMVERADKVWFFKMIGDQSLVTAQAENFRSLLDSVSFTD